MATDKCNHEERIWDGVGWVCTICNANLDGTDYAELYRLEQEHAARMEAEADQYEPDTVSDDDAFGWYGRGKPDSIISIEESAPSWMQPGDFMDYPFSFETFMALYPPSAEDLLTLSDVYPNPWTPEEQLSDEELAELRSHAYKAEEQDDSNDTIPF